MAHPHSHNGSAPETKGDRHHVHNTDSQRRILNRLSRIEGHVRGVKTMVQNDTYCPEVLIQIAAVRGALDRVARLILDEHLSECVARAAQEGNIEAELQELKEILDRFLP
ncbi:MULTISPECIES: metal-sensitive transcriptional regulator [Spirulina sp. CCY15215]|uniref:metal-sensitive transcriptional regulator n=1 Tax=Spirulina sp. CCY15215 TaxID=2767591 RepID=UPI0032AEA8EF